MTFRFTNITLEQFRCFEHLELPLEPDMTVLFAENGGGKSAVLNALAMGLAAFQSGVPRTVKFDIQRDVRRITLPDRVQREFVGPCTLAWTAAIEQEPSVAWSIHGNPASNRKTFKYRSVQEAVEQIRTVGARWPLFAYYGVDRMRRGKAFTRANPATPDRWEAYYRSLDPEQDDSALLTWLLEEILADTVRRQEGQTERFLATAAMEIAAKATPRIEHAWYNPRERWPIVRFDDGRVNTWRELSDGFHMYLSLVTDLARRAMMLSEQDGAEAPSRVEGVVLIDEIDLHLHPRWQRDVLKGLQETFPRLQFVVTTHSPQVLSSASNRQVRWLKDGHLQGNDALVEGRDSNAILRDVMGTGDRDTEGSKMLRELYDAIDQEDRDRAEKQLAFLEAKWGDIDPELVRARGLMDWEE